MRLGFWNNGNVKEVDPRAVRFPNGDMAYNASPDPARDLYEVQSATQEPCHPWQKEVLSYVLINTNVNTNIIVESRDCVWPPIEELKKRKKAEITAKRRQISSGVILVNGLKIRCTDGNIAELETNLKH